MKTRKRRASKSKSQIQKIPNTTEHSAKRGRPIPFRLRLAAYHEASHAVIHFATENPKSCSLTLSAKAVGASQYRHLAFGGEDAANVWMTLAGCIGARVQDIAMTGPGKPFDKNWDFIYLRLQEGQDIEDAAKRLFPDFQAGESVTQGRVGDALRNEVPHVKELLRVNWPIVERVAEAALEALALADASVEAVSLDSDKLYALIEEPDDLVHVWDSDVAQPYRNLQDKFIRRLTAGGLTAGAPPMRWSDFVTAVEKEFSVRIIGDVSPPKN